MNGVFCEVGKWLNAGKVYLQPKIISVFFLGFCSGLPLLLTSGTLSLWLAEEGISKSTIGLFALVGLPYTLKFCWAPLMDQISLPWLSRTLGRRRSWAILTQTLLMLSIVMMAINSPAQNPILTAILALLVAFFSASQDIVIDAYRVEMLEERSYAAGAAMVVFGYRLGMLISGAGALYLASVISWHLVYGIMALCVLVGVITVLSNKEPVVTQKKTSKNWFNKAVVAPFAEFMSRPAWLSTLMFILLFKLGDAFISNMSNPFYYEIGFSKGEIASVTKVFGLAAILIGTALGGIIINKIGLMRGLLICGILQLLSNLVFVAQAIVGHNLSMLTITIAAENITGGMGTAALVAYLSSLCNHSYTATQYALLSSFMAVGRTVISSGAGFLADSFSWQLYFIISTIIALPAIFLLLWMMSWNNKATSDLSNNYIKI